MTILTREERLVEYIKQLENEITTLELDEQQEIERMIPPDVKAAIELVSSRYKAKRDEILTQIELAKQELETLEQTEESSDNRESNQREDKNDKTRNTETSEKTTPNNDDGKPQNT